MNPVGTKKYMKSTAPAARGMVTGTLAAVFTTIGMALILAFAVASGRLQVQSVNIIDKLIWFVATLVGCLIGVGRTEAKKIFKAGSIVVGYIVILLCISAIMFNAEMQDILWGILCSAFGSLIGCAVKTAKGKGRTNRWQ